MDIGIKHFLAVLGIGASVYFGSQALMPTKLEKMIAKEFVQESDTSGFDKFMKRRGYVKKAESDVGTSEEFIDESGIKKEWGLGKAKTWYEDKEGKIYKDASMNYKIGFLANYQNVWSIARIDSFGAIKDSEVSHVDVFYKLRDEYFDSLDMIKEAKKPAVYGSSVKRWKKLNENEMNKGNSNFRWAYCPVAFQFSFGRMSGSRVSNNRVRESIWMRSDDTAYVGLIHYSNPDSSEREYTFLVEEYLKGKKGDWRYNKNVSLSVHKDDFYDCLCKL